ncbi:TonB-dependent receptor domain-containing protein [Algicella marina]|uniref:TonB-dependent receptor plug domain-containing protein n=1 Tax=Algicella marina TaxID=2683284 RepID=A0A6P1T0H6_9RHOB|nr:TonB-dependent receptor [Algicella marina]QHQ35143.1 TonB-dependent receptor plug domain-containing protein [Algicella marina]
MEKLRGGYLLLPACLAVLPTAVQAQNAVDLGTLRIESTGAQSVLGNEVIDEEDIENRNPVTTKDVFAGESSVKASGGASIAQKVYVNGLEESLLSVTIDGARQNKSAFHHTGNVLLDPAMLKSVEVSEGIAPADSGAGAGALAGSLAYETKDARDFLDPGDPFGGFASISGSDNGVALRSTLALFGQTGGFEWLLSGTRHISDDYEDGDGIEVPGTEADLTDYMVKLAFTAQGGERLSFSASQTEDNGRRSAQAGPGGILISRPDFREVVGATSESIAALSRRKSFTLTYTDEKPEGWFAPTAQLSYNEQEIDVVGVTGTNTSLSGVFKNDWSVASGMVSTGIDFFRETAEGEGRGPGPFDSSGEEVLYDIGVFAQARQDLTGRLSVSYGARADFQRFEAADGSTFESAGISGNAALDYKLTEGLSFNVGVASTWGGYELGEAALVNFGAPWTYDGLTTSRANAARVGLRYETGGWDVSTALFYTEINGLNAVLPEAGDRGFQFDLVSKGVDASLGYDWGNGFARVNYTYADVEVEDELISSTAYYVGRPAGHIVALEAGHSLNEQVRIGGTAEIAFDNNEGLVDLPGYEVLNLYAAYTPSFLPNMEVRFDVRNVFHETYASRFADGIDSPRVVPLPEPGRTLSLTANMRF